MKIDKAHLLKKGWTEKEIDHAAKILHDAEGKKHPHIKLLDKSMYWTLIGFLTGASIIFSAFIAPFIFAIQNAFVAVVIATLGFVFGVLFSVLAIDIEKIEHKNDKKVTITLLASGILNFVFIILFTANYHDMWGLVPVYSPYLMAGIFLFAYLAPHAVVTLTKPKEVGL